MVIVNGMPKAGNHAAVRACELLGMPSVLHHIPFGEPLPDGKRIFIKRDPRNMLISQLRADGVGVTQGMIITRIRKYFSAFEGSLVTETNKFLGWLKYPDTLVISYEALTVSDAEMRRIATYFGIPYLEDSFLNLLGFTATWTGCPSDWRQHWTSQIEAVWNNEGGPAMLEEWGY